jgi:integrase
VASCWLEKRTTPKGKRRVRVVFRTGGRESVARVAGTFATEREARTRQRWVLGELAAMRIPDLDLVAAAPVSPTLEAVAARWQASRVDASENTRLQHRSAVRAMLPIIGKKPIDEITVDDANRVIAELVAKGRKRETVRKTVLALGMILRYAGRGWTELEREQIRLPRGERTETVPPTAEHVQAVHDLLPARYRLPLLVLDATGMRLGELEGLTWGDVDEPRGRWRVSQAVSKTRTGRWVNVHPELFAAVLELCPRDDRTPERRVFQGFGGDRFRTAITRATTAAGVPAFSPHDLRHRRISLLHLGGVPWARIGEHVGQRNLAVTANTYTHVLADETELDYRGLLCAA